MVTSDNVLKLYLQSYFNKNIKVINDLDLQQLQTLYFNSKDFRGNKNTIDFSFIEKAKNLKVLIIKNVILNNNILHLINNSTVIQLSLENCFFSDNINFNYLNKIKKLNLNNCYIDSYEQLFNKLNNLKEIEIKNQLDKNLINVEYMNQNLERISLEKCKLIEIEKFSKFKNCAFLSILASKFQCNNFSFLENMENLKEFIISDEYKNYFQKNINNHCLVKYGYYDFVFDNIENFNHKI